MYQTKANAIQRARVSTGLTQEALAERIGYSDDTVRAWESGARVASLEALATMQMALGTPWLTGIYLMEQTDALKAMVPDFEVGKPLAQAAAQYLSCVLELVDEKVDRQLLRLVADGHIDDVERPVFDQIMEIAGRANRAYYEMRFAKEGN